MTSAFPSQRLKIRFLPAVPGTNAAGSAAAAAFSAQVAQDAANTAIQATTSKVDKAGDVMTGFLTLNANPTAALHAVTKQYADAADTANTSLANTKVPLAGGTMTGFLTLSADPTALLHAATKQYADAGDALKVAKAGDTMTGALILPGGLPTNPFQAVTKQYADSVGSGVFQPLDADLTSIAAQTVTGSWFFRRADGVYAPVIVGSNLTLNTTTGRLDAVGAGGGTGDVSSLGDTFSTNALAAYADGTGDAIRAMNLGPGLSIGGAAVPSAGTLSLDNELVALAGTTAAADQLPYFTSPTAAATTTLTAFARGLLDDGDAATMRATIGAAAASTSITIIGTPVDGQWAQWAGPTSLRGVVTASAPWVLKAGDTMSGDLTIAKAQPALVLNKAAAGQNNVIQGQTAGALRWQMNLGGVGAESGSNAGSNFEITRMSDAGALIDVPFQINRQTAAVSLTGDVAITKANPSVIFSKPAAGMTNLLLSRTGANNRWSVSFGNANAEGGGNAGSDFTIDRYSDAGALLDSPFSIARSTGIASFTASPTAVTPAAGDISTKLATTAFVSTSARGATYNVRGLQGSAGLTAGYNININGFNEAVVRDVNGVGFRLGNVGFIIDSRTIGAGGADVALADGDVSAYVIWGAVPGASGICSNANPVTGPALPSGYTHWGYLATFKRQGGSFLGSALRGNKVFYQQACPILSNGNSSVWATASSAAYVPAVALNTYLNGTGIGTCGGGGPGGLYFMISWTNLQLYVARLDCPGAANMSVPFQCVIPNVGQQVFYQWQGAYSVGNFTSSAFNIEVVGYEVPNGS